MFARGTRMILAAIIAAALPPSCLHGQTTGATNANDDGFIQSHWYGEDGMPHNAVNKIVRDSRGFLWLATHGGLARFDGRDFTRYNLPNKMTRGRRGIRSLDAEDEDTLVLISGSGKIVRLRNDNFELHPANQFIPADEGAQALKIDESGALWIGTDKQSLMRWDGERMQRFGPRLKLPAAYLRYGFASDADKHTWIAFADFLGWYDDDGLHRYDTANDHTIMIARSSTGGLWVASREKLARLENGELKVLLHGDDWPMPQAGISDLHEDRDGALWIATLGDRLFRLVDGRLGEMSVSRVESVAEDIDHNVWLGTNGRGLVRLKPRQYVVLNSTAGIPLDVSTAITEDETGALWIANGWGGAVRLKDGKTTPVSPAAGTRLFAENVHADQRGRVWVGAADGLYFTASNPHGDNWVLQPFNHPLPSVQNLLCATNGDLWVSWNFENVGVIRDGRLKRYAVSEGVPPIKIVSIAERAGPDCPEIWFGNERGQLFKLSPDGERFIAQPLPAITPYGEIFSLCNDSNNRLWVGTSLGLILWDGEKSRLFTSADGMPDDVIYQIHSDDHNRLWVNGRLGIFILEIEQLLAARNTPGRRITATPFGRDDNLGGISGGMGGKTWKTRDGRIWFPSYRGVVGFDANAASDTSKKLPVYIDSLLVNGKEAALSRLDKDNPVRIAPNPGQVEFQFSVLNFSTPDRTHVRRMLEGFDTMWVDASKERSSIYSRLPPGKYTFRVQAINMGGDISQADEAAVSVEIAAAWWQTAWFRICIVLAVVLAVGWCARRISNRILRQRLRRLELEKKLDQERARIARDLHDELGSRMSRIGFTADSIPQEQDRLHQKEMLASLTLQTRGLVEDLHRVVWTINPRNDTWRHLAVYISRYAQRLVSDICLVCTIDGVENIPDIPVTPDIRNHLAAITKESLNNILKHAKARHVRIEMAADNENFHLGIRDDGCGFDERKLNEHDGFGLENMRARMSESGGQIQIKSNPGAGTEIRLSVSLGKTTLKR
jgi:signal transduction histidine kinase/ligand-binding sensor domain-containing protein